MLDIVCFLPFFFACFTSFSFRYGYVDTDEDKRSHRPSMPKHVRKGKQCRSIFVIKQEYYRSSPSCSTLAFFVIPLGLPVLPRRFLECICNQIRSLNSTVTRGFGGSIFFVVATGMFSGCIPILTFWLEFYNNCTLISHRNQRRWYVTVTTRW